MLFNVLWKFLSFGEDSDCSHLVQLLLYTLSYSLIFNFMLYVLFFFSFLFSIHLLIYSSLYWSPFSSFSFRYFSTRSKFTFLFQFILNQFHWLWFQNNYPFEDYPVLNCCVQNHLSMDLSYCWQYCLISSVSNILSWTVPGEKTHLYLFHFKRCFFLNLLKHFHLESISYSNCLSSLSV